MDVVDVIGNAVDDTTAVVILVWLPHGYLLKVTSLCVSKVLKYPKKCLEVLTMFFMST